MHRVCVLLLLCIAVTVSAQAATISCPEAVAPGEPFWVTVRGEGEPAEVVVRWRARELALLAVPEEEGWAAHALLGLGLDPGDAPLEVEAQVGGEETIRCEMLAADREYPEQRLTVNRKYVELAQEDLDRHWSEKARVNTVVEAVTPGRIVCPVARPVPGGVNSVFGLRRFFNDQPRKPHSGVDLAGSRGDPVTAMAGGTVALAEEHFFSGNVVYLDHGSGVVTTYMHLDDIDVAPGERVAAGQVIGRVGDTGRVTGPHLHFGAMVLGERVDPLWLLDRICDDNRLD